MNNLSSFNFSQIKFIKTFLGIGISLFLLFLLIKKSQVEFSSAIKAITSLKTLLYFGLSCLSFLLMTLIHAYRTQIIFIDENTTWKSTKALKSLILGNFYNCLLPGNLGEGIRAYHFSKENRISFNKTLAVFFVEKGIDALMAGLLLMILFVITPFNFHIVNLAFMATTVAIIVFGFCLYFSLKNNLFFKFLVNFIWISKARIFTYKLFINFKYHILRLNKFKTINLFIIMGYSMFLMNSIQFILILFCVDLPYEMQSVSSALILSLCMIIILVIPSSPGNIGVAHYGLFIALEYIAEINRIPLDNHLLQQLAIASILMHFSYFLPEILMGVIVLFIENKKIF